MDQRNLEEIGKHMEAIATGVSWLVVIVYGLAATALAWLLW